MGQFSTWISDPVNGIKTGDVLLFTNVNGSALQTVTRIVGSTVYFDANDDFNFNQRTVTQGSIMQIRNAAPAVFPETTVVRLQVLTYYVDAATTPGMPRLTRRINHSTPQAMAGVVERLKITYDMADGVTNPTKVTSLPATISGAVLTGTQVRKVNLNVGVRSETRSGVNDDYLRHHSATVISLRGLAYKDSYK